MADTRELQLTERAYIITLLRILLFAVGGSVGAFCWHHTLRKSQIRVRSTELDNVLFRKLQNARMTISNEIVDCIEKVVVDEGGKIAVKWTIR